MRIIVPDEMKYFCISEAVAYYLQKYVVYRKRKIYVGTRTLEDLIPTIKKHKGEKFLLPCSDQKNQLCDLMDILIEMEKSDII